MRLDVCSPCIWTNWANGAIAGATLTITSQHGAFLVAFLALYVSFAGSQVWNICRFFVFRYRCSGKPRDIFFQQQQIILRNDSADTDAFLDFSKIAWAWRKQAERPWTRSLSLILWTGLHLLAFAAAGIFSSQVTHARSEVLLRNLPCRTYSGNLGGILPNITESFQSTVAAVSDSHENLAASSNFAASCYADNNNTDNPSSSTSAQTCQPNGRRQLQWSRTLQVPCPFANQSMCLHNATVSFDTGYYDSDLDLGINARSSDRIQFRKTLTCAPIVVDGYKSDSLNTSEAKDPTAGSISSDSSQTFVLYDYGPNPAQADNNTFVWSNYSAFQVRNGPPITPYSLSSRRALLSYKADTSISGDEEIFLPIPSLHLPAGGQLTLLFLTQYAAYWSAVTDPWFAATGSATIDGFTYWFSTQAASVLGCVERYWICNPNAKDNHISTTTTTTSSSPPNRHCVPVDSIGTYPTPDLSSILSPLSLTPKQSATAYRILTSLAPGTLHEMIRRQQGLSLLVNNDVFELTVAGLPPDQWIREVNHWFGTMVNFASVQSLGFVAGPNDDRGQGSGVVERLAVDLPGEVRWMCDAQIVALGGGGGGGVGYASFSVLGVVVILCVGGAGIVGGIAVERWGPVLERALVRSIGWLSRRVGRGKPDGREEEEEEWARLFERGDAEWHESGMLHMHRRLLRGSLAGDAGEWTDGLGDVPVLVVSGGDAGAKAGAVVGEVKMDVSRTESGLSG